MIGMPLENKVAIVTGARRGIGKAVALAFARAGADLAIFDLIVADRKLNEVAKEIRKLGRRVVALKSDISQISDVDKMVEAILSKFGKIDILVNCAGVWIPGQTLLECSEENWDKVINTNLKGTYNCCQVCGKVMVRQGRGNIINLSSQVGINPGAGVGAYSISKAGIIMLTRQLALELGGYNIRVNAIAPGIVKTDFNLSFWQDPEKEKQAANSVPLGRLAEPEDIADCAVFLASEDSRYITGVTLKVDGGWSVPGPGRNN
jgi:NAD(P)-dependent dehydrogenase (short-subunit alcohol dehydrogenase family)